MLTSAWLKLFLLQAFATSNLLTLYGIHQRFLNNIVGRFDEQLIDDFYRSVPWFIAVALRLPLCEQEA